MKPLYKQVATFRPHCPVCGEQLSGDNSLAFPWRCRCGIWKGNFINPREYEIEKEKKGEES